MDFKTAQTQLRDAKQKARRAEQMLAAAKVGLQDARPKTQEAHDHLISILALEEVGDATPQQVEDAKQKFEVAETKFSEAKREVAVKEKALPLFRQKVEVAKEAFREPAKAHYKKIAKPLTEDFLKALNEFEKVNQKVESLGEEILSCGFASDLYLPIATKSFNRKGLNGTHTFEKYKDESEKLIK